ncbi:MAG: hypothetical protein ABJQ39_08025 [Winogradskyella arenosi]
MRNKFVLLITLLFTTLSYGQKQVTWEDMSHVEYTDKFFPIYEEFFKYPTFLPAVKALEGKQIKITGYFLNIAPEDDMYMLSKSPMSSCFFCGQGEPDTVIELQFKNTPNFKTDAIVSVTGKLILNSEDVDHFIFILEDCKGELID